MTTEWPRTRTTVDRRPEFWEYGFVELESPGMTVTTADANDPWRFDDLMRRCAQTLFAATEDPELNERRARYRLGLLHIAEDFAADRFHDAPASSSETVEDVTDKVAAAKAVAALTTEETQECLPFMMRGPAEPEFTTDGSFKIATRVEVGEDFTAYGTSSDETKK